MQELQTGPTKRSPSARARQTAPERARQRQSTPDNARGRQTTPDRLRLKNVIVWRARALSGAVGRALALSGVITKIDFEYTFSKLCYTYLMLLFYCDVIGLNK